MSYALFTVFYSLPFFFSRLPKGEKWLKGRERRRSPCVRTLFLFSTVGKLRAKEVHDLTNQNSEEARRKFEENINKNRLCSIGLRRDLTKFR